MKVFKMPCFTFIVLILFSIWSFPIEVGGVEIYIQGRVLSSVESEITGKEFIFYSRSQTPLEIRFFQEFVDENNKNYRALAGIEKIEAGKPVYRSKRALKKQEIKAIRIVAP